VLKAIFKGQLLPQCAFVAGSELAKADVFGSVGRQENRSYAGSVDSGFLQLILVVGDMH